MSGYKRVNYYELCRLCTTTEGTKMHIFREEGRRRQISSKIPICLPLQIAENDSLPKIVCSSCVEKLESFFEFREACVNAEAMLESYFSTIRAEDHKEGQLATVYVREPLIAKETKENKDEVLSASAPTPAPAPTTLVVPVGTDGLSSLIQAAGIQIIAESESGSLRPPSLLGSNGAPVIETASNGTRYTYLNNAVPSAEVLERTSPTQPEKVHDNRDEVSQQTPSTPQVQPQTITFAGQEMMVHFNVKDTDSTNPQLQRASIAQLGEFLKMNLVDGATFMKDPSMLGGFRIVELPQTVLSAQHLREQQQQQQQQSLQLQEILQNQSLQHQEQQPRQPQQETSSQQHGLSQHLQQHSLLSPHKKRSKPTAKQQMLSQHQIQLQEQQHSDIQEETKVHQLQQDFESPMLQFCENQPDDDVHDDASAHEELDKQDLLSSSIEAVVGGAGGDEMDSRSVEKTIYSCDDCSKMFKRKEHLFQHQKLHTGERPFVCQHCDKTFVRKEHLLRHSISHVGTKQFECEQCGKNFSRKDNLHKHRKTHSGEGPYICQTCGKNFIVKHYFLMHLACHGAQVETENGDVVFDPQTLPFKCDVCGKPFPTKAFRDSHRLRHRKLNKKKNGDKDIKCESADLMANVEDEIDENHQLESGSETRIADHQLLPLQQNNPLQSDLQQCQELRQLFTRSDVVPVTLQANIPANGVENIIPHIIQQLVPTSSSAVIQVQSTANGTTYICSPEILETYRRLQSS